MSKKSSSRSELNEYWEEHVSNWESSGLSLSAYSKKHNIVLHRLAYWKKKLSAIGTPTLQPMESKPTNFIPTLVDNLNTGSNVEIITPSGICLKTTDGTDVAWISSLIQKLEEINNV